MSWRPAPDAMRGDISPLHDDDLQILARHDHCVIIGPVHACYEVVQISLQAVLLRRLESREGLEHWPVIGPEYFDEVLRRAIAKIEVTWLGLDPGGSGPE